MQQQGGNGNQRRYLNYSLRVGRQGNEISCLPNDRRQIDNGCVVAAVTNVVEARVRLRCIREGRQLPGLFCQLEPGWRFLGGDYSYLEERMLEWAEETGFTEDSFVRGTDEVLAIFRLARLRLAPLSVSRPFSLLRRAIQRSHSVIQREFQRQYERALLGIPYRDDCPRHRISYWFQMDAQNYGAMVNELHAHGPLLGTFLVLSDYHEIDHSTDIYHGIGDPELDMYEEDDSYSAHCVMIVGYGCSIDEDGNRVIVYWIIKNSHGREWGVDGFGRMGLPTFQRVWALRVYPLDYDVPEEMMTDWMEEPPDAAYIDDGLAN